MESLANASPRLKARIAGVFYLLTFLTGAIAVISGGSRPVGSGNVANLIATVCYLGVTLLFYDIFKPVNRSVSLLAALMSLLGCAATVLSVFHLEPFHVSPLVLFGCYCLLIGYLILRSAFLPGVLGALMMFGGLSWLTFGSPALTHHLSPYNMGPGILGEGALTLWLLVMGVDVQRWREQASAAIHRQS